MRLSKKYSTKGEKMFKKMFVLISLLTLMGMLATPALAARPDTYVFQFDDTHYAPRFSNYCGFPINVREWGTITDIVFYDKSGNYTGENFVLMRGGVAITNTLTGITFSSPTAGLTKYSLDSASVSGLTAHINMPGEDQLMIDAGRVIFDLNTGERVFEVGTHDYMDGNWQMMCEALTNP
jgi:hypothetical protein